jgi:hypothetical protein
LNSNSAGRICIMPLAAISKELTVTEAQMKRARLETL